MHEYDTVLKALLQDSQNSSIFERITGARIGRWLNVELPEVQQTPVDLLAETADAIPKLLGFELQSTNDPLLPLRMAEYALRVYRVHRRFPEQFVLYVGNAEMRMPSQLGGSDFHCRYTLVDIRTFDAEMLLSSPFAADNIVAILARHQDRKEAIRRILERIAKLESGSREAALAKLMILAGLRKLGDSIRTEVKYLPILDDIMDHDVIGPAIRERMQKGRKEEGLSMLRRLIEKRFGPLSGWAEERLTKLSISEMEDLSVRLFDAKAWKNYSVAEAVSSHTRRPTRFHG
jgi:predicted transposase YdaD